MTEKSNIETGLIKSRFGFFPYQCNLKTGEVKLCAIISHKNVEGIKHNVVQVFSDCIYCNAPNKDGAIGMFKRMIEEMKAAEVGKIGIVIPTRGDRKQFVEQALRLIDKQTRKPDFIEVVDYAPESDTHDITQRYRRGFEKLFAQGCSSAICWEDDDWYHPKFIETMVNGWRDAGKPEMFGIGKTLYYHIHTAKYHEITTNERASMMSTLVTPAVMGYNWPANDYPFLDIALWREAGNRGVVIHPDNWLAVGIKHGTGLCGGAGHKKDWKQYKTEDHNYKFLESIMGVDVNFYRDMAGKNKKIRVAIVTGVWQRPEVFQMFAKGVHRLETQCQDIELITIVAGSEGQKSRDMVEDHGFVYIEIENEPLATKMNATTLMAQKMKADYVLCVGSDDIVTPELMREYLTHMRKGIDYIGVTDFYFFDTETNKAAYWGGYVDSRKGHTAGAGRLISNRLMSYWNWQPWDVKHSHVLDNSMQQKLKTTPHTSAVFSLKEKGVYALDIKSSTNMTPFELWENTKFIEVEEVKKQFDYVW